MVDQSTAQQEAEQQQEIEWDVKTYKESSSRDIDQTEVNRHKVIKNRNTVWVVAVWEDWLSGSGKMQTEKSQGRKPPEGAVVIFCICSESKRNGSLSW